MFLDLCKEAEEKKFVGEKLNPGPGFKPTLLNRQSIKQGIIK